MITYYLIDCNQMSKSIESALQYAHSLIGLPYKWYRAGDPITGDEPFYAADLPAPRSADLHAAGRSIVCTGVANLLRRHVGLPVPPADADADIPFPGTTDAWFHYLHKHSLLEEFCIRRALAGKYQAGSLLLRNFASVAGDQGHVAILIDNAGLQTQILHAYAYYNYNELHDGPDGICGLTQLVDSHYYAGSPGYYTHICRPEKWLMPAKES